MYTHGKILKRGFLVALTWILVAGTLLVPPTYAEDTATEELYDLILEVRHGREALSQAIVALERGETTYLPVRELADVLGFAADVDLQAKTVQGFRLQQAKSYKINLSNNTYTVGEEVFDLAEDQAFALDQGYGLLQIYASLDLINQIWPIGIDVNRLKLILSIGKGNRLLYQINEERYTKREKAFKQLDEQEAKRNKKNLPTFDNSYKIFSLPVFNVSASSRFTKASSQLKSTLNLSGTSDLLKSQANYNLNLSLDGNNGPRLENTRFLLTRRAYYDDDLPLGLKVAQLGDIRSQNSRLIKGSLSGRGALISTAKRRQTGNFDEVSVEGISEPGWEVELYSNNQLIAFQIVDDSGEYNFDNVALNYSKTTLRTMLYGPQGQIDERIEVYDINHSMLSPGDTLYEVSFMDLNTDTFEALDSSTEAQYSGFAYNTLAKAGLNKNASIFARLTAAPTREGDHSYGTLGLNLSYLGFAGLIEGYKDFLGGEALDVRLARSLLGFNLSLRSALFRDFESDASNYGDQAQTSQNEATISRAFKLFGGSLGLRLNWQHTKYKAQDSQTIITTRQAYNIKKLGLSHSTTTTLREGHQRENKAHFNANYRIGNNWYLRSLVDYNIKPFFKWNFIGGEVRYNDNNNFSSAIDFRHSIQNEETRVGGQVTYDFEKFRGSLDVDWVENQGISALLRTNFSLAPHGDGQSYVISRRNLTGSAALKSHIFIDRDNDDLFSEGDEHLEDARLLIGAHTGDYSDEKGRSLYLSHSDEIENIEVDLETIPNPFLRTKSSGYSTVFRPGSTIMINFPLVETGSIDGQIIGAEGEPLSGVRVELLTNNAKQQLIAETLTAFDGFYLFEMVELGNYAVQLDPAYEQISIPPRYVSVTSENPHHYDMDFQLFEQAEEDACAQPTTGIDGGVTQLCQSDSDGDAQNVME